MSREIMKRLSDASLVALCLKGDEWPRAMLSSCLIPDGWMGFVQRSDRGRRFVPAGEDPQPESADMLLLVRNRAITVPLELAETAAADKHVVSAHGELLVRWQPRENDLAALRQSLMNEPTLDLERLTRVVAEAGTLRALRSFARSHPAEALAREDQREAFAAALNEALKRFLFESGLVLERVAKLTFASATLAERERLEREAAQRVRRIAAREQVEQAAAAATMRRLDDLSGVLTRLQDAARADADLRWHELLPTLSPPERMRLLENLWRITPNRRVARHIVAVAGRECLWLDPEHPAEIAHRLTLDERLGALRSAVWDEVGSVLLIGAASGLWSLDADGREEPQPYAAIVDQPPRTGFNAAAQVGDTLFGTHSELGCWMWDVRDPAAATPLLQPAQGVPRTVRAVTAVGDGRVAFAADACVHIHDPVDDTTDVLSPAPSTIESLAVLGDRLYAGTSDGHLLRADLTPTGAW
ncbi:MAG: hypothetical protein JXO22_08670, partial [Phycisphaerae bacterium]|nr:hypothetical protein [Phycisphaerae bacterium]